MKTNTYGAISNIKHVDHQGNDVIITDDTEKANVFAKYFSTVFTVEPVDSFEKLGSYDITHVMDTIDVTEEMALKKLLKLKIDKSPGPDMMHPRVLKEIGAQIASGFKFVFDMSLTSCSLPEEWK